MDMEGILTESVRTLVSQGTGWAVAIILGFACAYLFKRLQSAQEEYLLSNKLQQERREALQEKRIVEAKETVSVLNAGSHANLELARSTAARTEALNNHIQLVTQMERDMGSNDEHWQRRVRGLEQSLADITRRLEEIQRVR